MTSKPRTLTFAVLFFLAALSKTASAQTSEWFLSGQPASGPPITGAPYSGDGTTTVKLRLFDGTQIEQRVSARFYRDSAGRVRREQSILGLEAIKASSDPEKVVMILDPVAGFFYSLNPGSHQALRMTTSSAALAEKPAPPSPSAPKEESLGTRQIEGLTVIGRRTISVIPSGQIGNDRPITITDERWESPELKIVLSSRHHDPRTGDIEYRLTNISRAEPPPQLFKVPPTYTIVDGFEMVRH